MLRKEIILHKNKCYLTAFQISTINALSNVKMFDIFFTIIAISNYTYVVTNCANK